MLKNKKKLLILFSVGIIAGALIVSCKISKTSPTDYENSPFGFHPAIVLPPFEYGINNPYDFAADIGIKWDRSLPVIWEVIQPDPYKTEYDVNQIDRQLRDIPETIHMMANIFIGSPDPNMSPTSSRYFLYAKEASFLPKDERMYAKFVQFVVERYDGDGIHDMPGLRRPIKYWQVENEPPHGLNDYAEFLKITFLAIKEADPEAKVLIGGVAGTIGGTPGTLVSTYLKEFDRFYLPILDKLARSETKYFDIFDFHWYGDAKGDYQGVRDVYNYIRQKIDKRGLTPDHGYWVTEMGTYSGDPLAVKFMPDYNPPFQTEKQQAIDLIKRYISAFSVGIKKVFTAFGLKEGFKYDEGYFDFTGLIYDGKYEHDKGKGVKKLAYYTYKRMVEVLEGSDWDNIQTIQEREEIYIYKFIRDGGSIWVAWNDSGKSKRISLRLGKDTKGVKITESVPKYKSGKEVTHYDTAFRNIEGDILESFPLQLSFELREIPVFVEEK